MVNQADLLKNQILGRKTNPEKQLLLQTVALMMELNISYKDMMEMPISAYVQLSNGLTEIKKMEAKLYKKGK